jgi:hypothetical protein
MGWEAWKSAEQEVSEYFKGKRRIRVSYNEKVGDIIHPVFSIEVKYGKQVPGYLKGDVPFVLEEKYWGMLSACLKKGLPFFWERKKAKGTKFIDEAMEQAKRYYPKKIPMVCVKSPRQRGFTIVVGKEGIKYLGRDRKLSPDVFSLYL